MTNLQKKFYITLTVIAAFAIINIGSYISWKDYGNGAEKEIIAAYTNNQNVLSQYSNKISEMAQIPGMYKNDLSDLYKDAMGGRYGADGSKAMFQFIKEVNPSIDASMYTSIQQAMRAGRTKFENAQKILIEKKRIYDTNLGNTWSGYWLAMAQYPKINLDDYKIIMSTYANKAFEEGVEDGIKIGG